MNMTEALENSVDESEEWVYNYYGRDRVEQIKAEGKKEGREEGREEGRKEGREEGRKEGREEGRKEGREEGRAKERISVLNMLKMHYPVMDIGKIFQIPEAEVIKIARDNHVVIP